MASDEKPCVDHTVPGLNYQTWEDFNSPTNGTPSFSIDILRTNQPDSEVPAQHDSVELPERIRVNSDSIIQLLSRLRRPPRQLIDGPIIMFRPYKTLVCFDREIRQTAADLEVKERTRSTPAKTFPGLSDSGSEDDIQLAHLRCLIQFMNTHLCARLAFLHGQDCNTVFFSDLWLLYSPGDFVISSDLHQVYQVIRVEMKRRIAERNGKFIRKDDSVIIHCVFIDFDGKWLGPVQRQVAMKAWVLGRQFGSLELLPLNRAIADKRVVRDDLIRRGQTFVQVAGILPIHYDGYTLDSEMRVNGTVMVDFEAALRDEENFKPWRTTIEHDLSEGYTFSAAIEEYGDEAQLYVSEHGYPQEDLDVDDRRYQAYMDSQCAVGASGERVPSIAICARLLSQADSLTEKELFIMHYRVFGHLLKTGPLSSSGNWAVFDLSLSSAMPGKSSLDFDNLVIPSHIKEILKNLSTRHLQQMSPSRTSSDQSIAGKHEVAGQGLVFLLHGAASVGKKSTAATIARMAGVPILQISTELLLGDMWQDQPLKFIERSLVRMLEQSFTLAERWGCIVMLTQADAILQGEVEYNQGNRTGELWDYVSQGVLRRAVVQMLDSFPGMTFLIADQQPFHGQGELGTSAKEILSRINASFRYLSLSRSQTVKIFEINMRWINDVFSKQHQHSLRPATLVVDEDILRFATAFHRQCDERDRWNCMQIRKAFSTALALAQADAEFSPEAQASEEPHGPWKVTLKAAHFEAVAKSMPKGGRTDPIILPPPPGESGLKHDVGGVPPTRLQPQQPPGPPLQHYNQRPQLPQQSVPQNQLPPPVVLPNSRQLPPVEYRAQIQQPPPPKQTTHTRYYGKPPKFFFLPPPLSISARPELDFLDWDHFKEARAGKDDACAAIDILKGDPVVSFDEEAQESVWWSQWGSRNRGDATRPKSEASASALHKWTGLANSGISPLPEHIRIHSKYITAILEGIRGSPISKTSFVMVRPFRALTHDEERIRAKYTELAMKFEKSPGGSDVEPVVPDSVDLAIDVQPEHPRKDENDGLASKDVEKLSSDDSDFSSSYFSEDSISDVEGVIDISCHAALQHLACLVEFIDMIRARRQYLLSGSCSKVTFAEMWHLFKPGDEILDHGRRQAYRILSVNSSDHRALPPWKYLDSEKPEGLESVIVIHSVHITFDGEMLGSTRTTFTISSFEGEQDVSSLPVLPLQLFRNPDAKATTDPAAFRKELIERGRMFVRIAKTTPMHYNGPLLHPREEVDSQVVIDFEQAFSFWARDPSFKRPVVEKLIGKKIGQARRQYPCYASCCAGENVQHGGSAEQKWNEAYIGTLIPDPQDRTQRPSLALFPRAIRDKSFNEAELSDEDLVIMSYKVCGFVLRSRRWAQMDLKYLSSLNPGAPHRHVGENTFADRDVTRSPNGTGETTLDQLVLPPGHKNIVKSLISQHFQDKATGRYEAEEKDLVRGKGKGLIILLHGAPGVGKTSTAEGVAEAFNKPLFQVTSGDLGTNARELEESLEWHFYLAHKWDCVLLLDEADVFLSVRSPEDFQRNSLVAVFLRVLEYYAGVLFLTTNRIGDFDEAFSSRIHISLYYPPLKRSSTSKIFDLNLRNIKQRIEERGVEIEVEHEQILAWAVDYWRQNKKMRWNGRQIRNACQTALALAEYDAQNPMGVAPDALAGQEEGDVKKAAKIKLTISHLETVAKAYLEFMRYLNEIYGKDAERRAKHLGIRARELSMKSRTAPAEEEDDESDDEATRATAAQKNMPVPHQQPGHAMGQGTTALDASAMGVMQQSTPFPAAPSPYQPFPMPNPYAVPGQYGQTPQPPAAPYQQTSEQQRQYFASMAAWNNMMAGGQQVPFPGVPGMAAQAPGASQAQGGLQMQGGPQMQGGASFPSGSGA